MGDGLGAVVETAEDLARQEALEAADDLPLVLPKHRPIVKGRGGEPGSLRAYWAYLAPLAAGDAELHPPTILVYLRGGQLQAEAFAG